MPGIGVDRNSAETTFAELFHVVTEGLQGLAQWLAARHPFQYVDFSREEIRAAERLLRKLRYTVVSDRLRVLARKAKSRPHVGPSCPAYGCDLYDPEQFEAEKQADPNRKMTVGDGRLKIVGSRPWPRKKGRLT